MINTTDCIGSLSGISFGACGDTRIDEKDQWVRACGSDGLDIADMIADFLNMERSVNRVGFMVMTRSQCRISSFSFQSESYLLIDHISSGVLSSISRVSVHDYLSIHDGNLLRVGSGICSFFNDCYTHRAVERC